MTVPAFLINLEGSGDRLASASAALGAEGIAFERVAAFDGRGRDPRELPGYDEAAALAYMGRPLRGGEIGCYLSHLEAARRVLAGGEAVGLVVEDDLTLVPGAGAALERLAEWLGPRGQDWDLVNLGANRMRIATPLRALGGGHRLLRAHYFPMTTTALLWSRGGAGRFVAAHDRIAAPVDNHFRRWLTASDRGLAVWPPLAATTGAESEIDAAGAKRRHGGRHRLYGLRKQRRLWADKGRALLHKAGRAVAGDPLRG